MTRKTRKRENRESTKAGMNAWLTACRYFNWPFVWRVYEAADAQWLLAEIDQQAQAILPFVQVKQALLYVFGQDDAACLRLQQQFVGIIPSDEVHPAACYRHPVEGNGDFDLALVRESTLLQSYCQRPLPAHFRAVDAQLTLQLDTSADDLIRESLEAVALA